MQSLTDVEHAILRAIRTNGIVELRRGAGAAEVITTFMPDQKHVSPYEFMESTSALIARRLVFLEFSQPDSTYWSLRMADRGYRAIDDQDISPDDPRGYMQRLLSACPDDLADSLETQVIAAMHLIRANRNDAGHPTKILVDEFTAYTNIAIYWRLHQKLYSLKTFFVENKKD